VTEPDAGLLSTNQVAEALGVSPARVRQLHGEGLLPPPIDLGARVGAWHWTDIAVIKAQRDGATTSPLASLLTTADQPLTRIREQMIQVEAMSGPRPVHLRVWQCDTAEGERTVALLGSLDHGVDVVGQLDACVETTAALLRRPAEAITWFVYRPYVEYHMHRQQVEHLIVGPSPTDVEGRGRGPWVRLARAARQPRGAVERPMRWRRASTLGEVERLIGGRIEAYPGPAYRPEIVEDWQRRRRTIEVTLDTIYFEEFLRAITNLQWVTTETRDPQRLDDIRLAMWLMADEVRNRLDLERRNFDDGTAQHTAPNAPAAYWPGTWAARLVLPRPDQAEQDLLDQYPTEFRIPKAPAEHGELRGLLARLRSWAEDVDPYSGRHDPALFTALSTATNLLGFYLGVYDEQFRENDHPDTAPALYMVGGQHDRAYLRSVTWLDRPPKRERAYHRLRAELGLEESPRLRYGHDARGALVIHDPADVPDSPWSERYATEWPLRPPAEGIPAGSEIVADAGRGDRPAYILEPGGRITPLPKVPDRVHSQWSFGYSGGGPGALAYAITSAIRRADKLGTEPFTEPTWARWVDNRVCFGQDERPLNSYDTGQRTEPTEFRLSVDAIRLRYARS
jgi:predicted DNA-binding transcriptional regulator AlpA